MIKEAMEELKRNVGHIYYIDDGGIATSLSYPLILVPLILEDSDEVIKDKMNLVAKYIETFAVRRSINYRNFSSSSIRCTMYALVKEIRNKSIDELKTILTSKLNDMPEKWEAIESFSMHR